MKKLKCDAGSTSIDLMVAIEADVRFERERERAEHCRTCTNGDHPALIMTLFSMVLNNLICMFEAKLRLPVGQDANGVAMDLAPDMCLEPDWVERGSKRHLYRHSTVTLLREHLQVAERWEEVLAQETSVTGVAGRQVCLNPKTRIQ